MLPEDAGVIVRTAAEGATEDQLTRDVTALKARWEDIEKKVEAGKAPELLYAEPDLMIKVVRDLFNEDFASLVVEGDDAWDNISAYVNHVAPDLADRASAGRPDGDDGKGTDAFTAHRIDEQIHKALERKVFLPSGGSLVIDRTEAMTVVDVNTGKFTGSGGNLEETVTKNNLEAAEEMVRQLRLRDIGGIIVIDFIDMVLESNRDLVLRRLVECLGRDRTRHQVAEITSLGLVQMTRKRIGTGLLESFSHDCEHCKGRGVVITAEPVEPKKDEQRRGNRRGGGGGGGKDAKPAKKTAAKKNPSAKKNAAPRRRRPDDKPKDDEVQGREAEGRAQGRRCPRFDRRGPGSVEWNVGERRCAEPLSVVPSEDPVVYAIVRSGGTQQKVAVGDVVEIDKVTQGEGEKLSLPAVLLVDGDAVTSDAKALAKVSVTAEVLGQTKGPKIIIQKYKNKTGYKKRQGHRQKYTQVKITGITK